jgi:mono/diheme cytochrome c family protein
MTELRLTAAFVTLLVGLTGAMVTVGANPVIYNLPDETAKFEAGPGVELAEVNCSACHSADYISTQPPKQGKAFWQAEVTKMIKVYGAPIAEQDVNKIAEYLAATY